MAAKNNIEFKVGIIILLGIIVVGASLYWLQGYRLMAKSRMLRVHFKDVGALSVGDKVTVSGVHVGKVGAFYLKETGVVVELMVSRDVELRRDATFAIRNLGVMGERFVAIDPGTDSIPLDTLAIAQGAFDVGIPQIMGLLGETITEVRELLASFKDSFKSDSPLKRFNQALTNIDRVTSSLANYLDKNESKLHETTDNFLHSSRELRNILATNAEKVDSSMARIDRMTVSMETLVVRLDSLAVTARSLAEELESGDGTLQLLLRDRALYDDLRKTADDVDELVNDIRANPRKYINLKFELF